MRKVIVYVNLTLDGHLCGPDGELDWMDPNPEMNQEFSDELRARVDTMLVGRNAHLGFEQHFSASAADPASPAGLVDFSKWMVDTPKVVFSSTLTEDEVSPVSRIGTDVVAEVAALKAAEGGDIVAFAGVTLVNSLIEHGLVDEYWIKLCATAIGAGRPMFPSRTPLRLVDSKAWGSGTLTLRYVPA
jgi:dihydrofolate reductase